MSDSNQTVGNIYFTSWQYVRIGAFKVEEMSSAGSGVSWMDPNGGLLRPPCDATGEWDEHGVKKDESRGFGKFLDEGARYVPSSPRGIKLVAQQPTRVRFDDPLGMDLEASPVSITIIQDEGKYKCWYGFLPLKRSSKPPLHQFNQHMCYAESTDGFKWTKPNLGLFEYEGSRNNNIVMTPLQRCV